MKWRVVEDVPNSRAQTSLGLECEDMAILHDALGLHLDKLQELIQRDPEERDGLEGVLNQVVDDNEDPDLAGRIMGVLSGDYIRAKRLRAKLVELVGEDLTKEGGC